MDNKVILALGLLAVAGGGYWWWRRKQTPMIQIAAPPSIVSPITSIATPAQMAAMKSTVRRGNIAALNPMAMISMLRNTSRV